MTTQHGTDLELGNPSIESDQLVASGGFSIPFADIVILESQDFSLGHTVPGALGGVIMLPVASVLAIIADCNTAEATIHACHQ